MDESRPVFRAADLEDDRIRDLLATHTERALSNARCRQGHALDVDALDRPEIDVRSIWIDHYPVAVGALRILDANHGELKSMFVADEARGQGMGRRLLDHLIRRAQKAGMSRLSLETGTSEYFDAARALYERNGFEVCDAFADLPPHEDSVFMTREI
ncbi:MAG TPA: GNAT family N-acetyltransferase [Sphingomonadaceae bacterium]|nr:GNAT family N-acetyltransferase [Sphingomonadaceae bacterium]